MQSSQTDANSTDPEIIFSSELVKSLYGYWQTLAKQASGLPARDAFDPIAIPTLLPFIVLYERLTTDEFQVRLQGTGFSERGISDVTGNILSPDETDPGSLLLNNALRRVIDAPCGLKIVGVERNEQGKNALVEGLGLPLCDNAGTVRFVVAIVAPLKTIDYSPAQPTLSGLTEVRETAEIPLENLLPQND
jgi:hypothetical protein